MNDACYRSLRVGDLVRHKASGDAMVVVEMVNGVPVVARYQSVHNPAEWDAVNRSGDVISLD